MTAPARIPDPHRKRRPEPPERRSLQPVHRRSRLAGGWEIDWFGGRLTPREQDDRYEAAKLHNARGKRPGDRTGPLGPTGLLIYRQILTWNGKWRGKLYPTIAKIALEVGVCVATAIKYLRRLKEAGLLEWQRRIVPKPDAEPWERGPQVEQTSNVYRLVIPAWMSRVLSSKRPPSPDDDQHRRTAVSAQLHAMARAEAAAKLDAIPAVAAALAKSSPPLRPPERD